LLLVVEVMGYASKYYRQVHLSFCLVSGTPGEQAW